MAKNLSAFLAKNAKKVDNVAYVVSNRFINEETGKPEEWEICCITAAENESIKRNCTRSVQIVGKKGQYTQEIDSKAYFAKVASACTVHPNLNDEELQKSYGVNGSENLLMTMLTPGEFTDYYSKVLEVNGFENDLEMVGEAKN